MQIRSFVQKTINKYMSISPVAAAVALMVTTVIVTLTAKVDPDHIHIYQISIIWHSNSLTGWMGLWGLFLLSRIGITALHHLDSLLLPYRMGMSHPSSNAKRDSLVTVASVGLFILAMVLFTALITRQNSDFRHLKSFKFEDNMYQVAYLNRYKPMFNSYYLLVFECDSLGVVCDFEQEYHIPVDVREDWNLFHNPEVEIRPGNDHVNVIYRDEVIYVAGRAN